MARLDPPPGGPKTALHTGGYVRGPRGYVRASKFTCLRGVAGDMCGDLRGMCGGLAGYVRRGAPCVRGFRGYVRDMCVR